MMLCSRLSTIVQQFPFNIQTKSFNGTSVLPVVAFFPVSHQIKQLMHG